MTPSHSGCNGRVNRPTHSQNDIEGACEGKVRRYGKRPPEQRQLTYDIAANDEYAPWRHWLDAQLALLPAQAAEAMSRRVWLDEHFWPVNFELAVGAGLRAAGLGVPYEEIWDGVTPDWTVLSGGGKPLAFVEVHTDQPPPRTFGEMRAWHGLVERIKTIPVPWYIGEQTVNWAPVPPWGRWAQGYPADARLPGRRYAGASH